MSSSGTHTTNFFFFLYRHSLAQLRIALHFVDRKNIIRRSGENIAAAEIEAVLLTHPDVRRRP